jgi:pyruvate formate lyase activating enzyme
LPFFYLVSFVARDNNILMKTALYWHAIISGRVQCDLCPHQCRLANGQWGLCKARQAMNGELKAAGYGHVSAAHLDPVEKKPLYHFHPGTMIFSIGGWGCNLGCEFCQNWGISQQSPLPGPEYTPDTIAEQAVKSGSIGVAYTYNEPLIGHEFVSDCAQRVRANGLSNVLVTNGFVLPGPADALLPWIDAVNLDIKSMEESFYKKSCHAALPPVLDFACQARAAGCHMEITNLVIPGMNDQDGLFEQLGSWMAAHLGRHTPLHLSAYHPDYKSKNPPTPLATLEHARELCARHLDYVYIGNQVSRHGADTGCPGCHATLIERVGYSVKTAGLTAAGLCEGCGRAFDGLA